MRKPFLFLFGLSLTLFSTEVVGQAHLADTVLANEYFQTADSLSDLSKYQAAIDSYKTASELYKNARNWQGHVKAHNWISINYRYLYEYEQSEKYLYKAIALGIEYLGESDPIVANSYNFLGVYYYIRGNYQKASEPYLKALAIRREIFGDKHPDTAQSYGNMGTLYSQVGDFEKALDYIYKTLQIRLDILGANDFDVAETYNNLGGVYQLKGDFRRALENHQESLKIRLNILGEGNPWVGQSYNNIGGAYHELGEYDSTFIYAKKALKIWLNVFPEKHPLIAKIYSNLGRISHDNHDNDRAIFYTEKSLKIMRSIYGEKHPDIASVYRSLGDYHSDLMDFDKSLEFIQKALMSLSDQFQDTNIEINPPLRQINSKPGLLEILKLKGQTLNKRYKRDQNKNDLQLSFDTYNLAIELIDTMRFEYSTEKSKQDFTEKSIAIYEGAVNSAFLLNKLTGNDDYLHMAFEITEKSKAFLLRQAFQQSEAKNLANVPDNLISQEQDLKIDVRFYEKRLFEAKNKKDTSGINRNQNRLFDTRRAFDSLVQSLEENYPEYYQLKYRNEVVSVKDIQENLLGPGSAFIEYFQGDDQFYVFHITTNDLKVNTIEKSKDFKAGIKTVRDIISVPPGENDIDHYRTYNNEAHALYELLLMDIFDQNKTKELVIVPDGTLSLIPFEILLTEAIAETSKVDEIDYQILPYLMNQFQISYAYSGTLLMENNEELNHNNNGRCLAFAPSYSGQESEDKRGDFYDLLRGEELNALPGAQEEVKNLAQHVQGSFLFGPEATEDNFKQAAEKYSILHLAMHGTDDDQAPLYSKLYFTDIDNSQEDDTLHTYELYNMNLNADLVVLSACETGQGKFVRGEGVLSLARGFMYAGSPSVVQTLWSASDKTSPKIIDSFYKALSEGYSKDEALTFAKRQYLQEADARYSHPFYWASFILYGDSKPLSLTTSSKMVWWLGLGGFILLMILMIRNRIFKKEIL